MTGALLDAPTPLFADCREARPAGGRRTTLAELLDGTWRAARTHAGAECPLCHATMRLDHEVARCEGCGTTLS